MKEEKSPKNNRVLDIYTRLTEGHIISKAQEAQRFGVDERSIQRDIDDIRAFLADRQSDKAADNRLIEYDYRQKGFVMTGAETSVMTNSEILAVSKVLLASRAFTKKEISSILKSWWTAACLCGICGWSVSCSPMRSIIMWNCIIRAIFRINSGSLGRTFRSIIWWRLLIPRRST